VPHELADEAVDVFARDLTLDFAVQAVETLGEL
jgi:hypothetical protein